MTNMGPYHHRHSFISGNKAHKHTEKKREKQYTTINYKTTNENYDLKTGWYRFTLTVG